MEIATPYLTDEVFAKEITQEANAMGQIQFKRNVTGLWMIQECRRIWQNEGKAYSYGELSELSKNAESKWVLDTTEPCFAERCDMPSVIIRRCMELYGDAPQTPGEICRTIEQSLAGTYSRIINDMETVINKRFDKIYMVGGGIRNKQLSQMTANQTQREVIAGPVEATVLGNLSMQMVAMKLVNNLNEASAIVSKLETPVRYLPQQP